MAGFGAQFIPSVIMGVGVWAGPEIEMGCDMNVIMTKDPSGSSNAWGTNLARDCGVLGLRECCISST